MTSYNRRIYKIDSIDLNKSPKDGFEDDQGKFISFKDYYRDKYKAKISNESQPLLVHIDEKKNQTTKKIYLIPEFCVMTGLSEQNRSDFNLMKSLDQVIKPNAGKRLSKC